MGGKSKLRKAWFVAYDLLTCVVLFLAALVAVPVLLGLAFVLCSLYYMLVHAPGVAFGCVIARLRRWCDIDAKEDEPLW